jgi:tetratricopeptide (TPR) repeat protein
LSLLLKYWHIVHFWSIVSFQNPTEQVEDFKKQGNAEFSKQNYDAAITFYTQALSMCPQSEKGLLSTVYQNRAAAYSKLVLNNYLLIM